MARLFVAAWPTPEVRQALEALPRPDEPGVRWVPPHQWHVTLRFLGDADPDQAGEALEGLRVPAATATFGPAVSRLGRTVICVPAQGMDQVAAQIAEATAQVGAPPDPRPFTGHLTLARLGRRGSCRLAGHRVAAEQRLDTVDLVVSERGDGGPAYRSLLTVPLR